METQEEADISDKQTVHSVIRIRKNLNSLTPNERTNKTPRNGPSPKKPDENFDIFNELQTATDALPNPRPTTT